MISNDDENQVLAGVIKGLEWEAERRVQNPPQRVQSLPFPARSSNPQPTATFAKSRIRLCHRYYVNGTARALYNTIEVGNGRYAEHLCPEV